MASLTSTTTSGNQTDILRDLGNVIFNTDPWETPVTSTIGKKAAVHKNRYHEFVQDKIPTIDTTNYHVEGDDFATGGYTASTPRGVLGNYHQILEKALVVSDTARVVEYADGHEELAYQAMLLGKTMQKEIEYFATGNQVQSSSEPRKMSGIQTYLVTNLDLGAGGAAPTDGSGTHARTAGTNRAGTEASVNAVAQSIWQHATEVPKRLFVSGNFRTVMNGFNGGATKYNDMKDDRLYATYKVYETAFGDITIVPSRFHDQSTAQFINPKYASMVFLRDFKVKDLASNGDNSKKLLSCECTVEVSSEKAHGMIADLL